MTLTGRDVLLEVLDTEGVAHVFGNPGTTELPFIDALAGAANPAYVLALHEGTAVAMADGYAQVTRRPSFVNVHTASGLGNALGVLANVRVTRTPMVVSAGQQDQRHLLSEPFLWGDLVEMAGPLVKWAREVRRADDLGTLLRRAFRDAAHQPTGPVFVSIPMDVLDEQASCSPPPVTPVEGRAVPAALHALAGRIGSAGPGRLAIVAGDEVARSSAVGELVAVAEKLGCPVFGTPLHSNTVFPTLHPLWAGALEPDAEEIRHVLEGFDVVLLIGDRGFMTFGYRESTPVPGGVSLLHLSPVPADLGRTYPASLAMAGDPKATLAALLPLLVGPALRAPSTTRAQAGGAPPAGAGGADGPASSVRDGPRARRQQGAPAMDAEATVRAVLEAVPADTTVVDEGPTTDPFVRRFHRVTRADSFFYSRGGGLGWGMGAAMGVSLGKGREPVLCMVGDGSTLYAPQALWTAARMELPVVFALMNNGGYLILKRFLDARKGPASRSGRFPGMDVDHPEVDFVSLARSFGVAASRPSTPSEAAEEVRDALDSRSSRLLDIRIQPNIAGRP